MVPTSRGAGDRNADPAFELVPHLADAVDRAIVPPHPPDLLAQPRIVLDPRRLTAGIALPSLALVVDRWGDRQHRADRLDPVRVSGVVDKPAPSLRSAVELCLGEKRRRLLEDLVGAPQLDVLPLELLQPLPLLRRPPRALALVPLRLPDPFPERLGAAADFLGNRRDRRPLRLVRPL